MLHLERCEILSNYIWEEVFIHERGLQKSVVRSESHLLQTSLRISQHFQASFLALGCLTVGSTKIQFNIAISLVYFCLNVQIISYITLIP